MEEKCFARLRENLHGWRAMCAKLYPDHVWTGPDPERCGLQRLGGGGAVISDTCTPARCTQRLLIAEVARQVAAKTVGWAQLSEAAVLKPCDWNQEVPMGWRFTAAELQRFRDAQKQ